MKKMKEKTKTSNRIGDSFALPFFNLSLAWILLFHVWLQNKEGILSLEWIVNNFGMYQRSRVYASIICYPLFGKIEDADNIDSVAM